MMGFAVIVGTVLAGSHAVVATALIVLVQGSLTGFLLTASSMVLNDYADLEIDSINEPSRPLPSGAISPKHALVYGLGLMILGLAFASILGIGSFLLAGAAWLLFLAYTLIGKKTGFPGNVLVSVCVAMPFLYGAVILSGSVGLRIVIFASIAFLANLGREVTKGIVDIEGDKAKGVKTVAVRVGRNPAAFLAALFFLVAIGFSALPVFWEMVSVVYYLPFVLVTDLGLGYTTFSLVRNPSRDRARSQKRFVLLWMVFGLVAFLAGSA
jgi:geranylgeranylglycerol-phosphate geranylgeranyltransferase